MFQIMRSLECDDDEDDEDNGTTNLWVCVCVDGGKCVCVSHQMLTLLPEPPEADCHQHQTPFKKLSILYQAKVWSQDLF